MKIRMLTDVRHAGLQYHAGDSLTVDDATGGYFVNCGWAEDQAGQLETGEASTDPVTLEVQSSAHEHTSEDVSNG